jgi:hypothetical protein
MDLKALARRGAEVRLAELQSEMNELHAAFPGLRSDTPTPRASVLRDNAGSGRKQRKPMTAAQRRAVGIRMKKYWAAKRKAAKA